MLKFALEIAWRGAGNHVERFRKSRGKVEEIAKRSSGNHVEKFKKSPGRVSTLSGNAALPRCRVKLRNCTKIVHIIKKNAP